jgi:hypothetical protein
MESARHTSDMCPAKGGVRVHALPREFDGEVTLSSELRGRLSRLPFWKGLSLRGSCRYAGDAWLLRALCCASAQPVTDANQTLVALHLLRPPPVRSQWLCPDDSRSLTRAGGRVRKHRHAG